MDETAAQLLKAFARASRDIPRRQDWPRFYEFVIYAHRHQLLNSTNDVTQHLVANGFTLEEARRVAWVYAHGIELLSQYDKHVTA
jgi:hypothetical protein